MSPPVHTNPRECRSVSTGEPPCRGLSPPVRGSLSESGFRGMFDPSGLSPPVRGSLCGRGGGSLLRDRSIPARAGEPRRRPRRIVLEEVGLSPPVRGSHRNVGVAPPAIVHGSIPARAGEPPPGSTRVGLGQAGVYPRPCGGADRSAARSTFQHLAVYPRPCGGA